MASPISLTQKGLEISKKSGKTKRSANVGPGGADIGISRGPVQVKLKSDGSVEGKITAGPVSIKGDSEGNVGIGVQTPVGGIDYNSDGSGSITAPLGIAKMEVERKGCVYIKRTYLAGTLIDTEYQQIEDCEEEPPDPPDPDNPKHPPPPPDPNEIPPGVDVDSMPYPDECSGVAVVSTAHEYTSNWNGCMGYTLSWKSSLIVNTMCDIKEPSGDLFYRTAEGIKCSFSGTKTVTSTSYEESSLWGTNTPLFRPSEGETYSWDSMRLKNKVSSSETETRTIIYKENSTVQQIEVSGTDGSYTTEGGYLSRDDHIISGTWQTIKNIIKDRFIRADNYELVESRSDDQYVMMTNGYSIFVGTTSCVSVNHITRTGRCTNVTFYSDECVKPPPPPPPKSPIEKPPPPPPIMTNCCNNQSVDIARLEEAIERLEQVIGTREILDHPQGFGVPNKMLIPGGDGYSYSKNYLNIFTWLFAAVDRYGFDGPIIVDIADTDKGKAGNQSLQMQVNSLSTAIQTLLSLAVENKGDQATRLNIQIRLAFMLTRLMRMMHKMYYLVVAILEGLGIPTIKKYIKNIPFEFNLNPEDIGFGSKAEKLDTMSEDDLEAQLPKILDTKEMDLIVEQFKPNQLDLRGFLIKLINKK